MNTQFYKELKRERNINLIFFLLMNFIIIGFLSTLNFDRNQNTLLEISILFDPIRTVVIMLVVTILQIIILYLSSYAMFQDPDMVKIFPEIDQEDKQTTIAELSQSYDIENIKSMVHELADLVGVNVDTIYLTSTPIPNAFTFSLPGRGTIVNINTNIMDFLTEDEIRSVIVHELAHIKEKDSLQKLIANAPSMYIQLALSYFYALFIVSILNSLLFDFNIGLTIVRSLLLVLFFGVSRFIIYISQTLIARSERASEMICDLHAADLISPTATINLLVHLGQRVETVNTLMKEFTRMEKLQKKKLTTEDQKRLMHLISQFPEYEIDENQARIYAPFLYILNQLEILTDIYGVPLDQNQIVEMSSKAAQSHIRKDTEEIRKIESMTTNWREFDINQDQMLSEQELKDFVRVLYEEKNKFLFANEIYVDHLIQEHPDFRKRILNVYEAYYN